MLLEVHINPMGHDNNLRTQMNGYFENVFDSSVIIQIDGVPITSMNATDHVLFLTCHEIA